MKKVKHGNNDIRNLIHQIDMLKHSIDKETAIKEYRDYFSRDVAIDEYLTSGGEGELQKYENWLGANLGDKKG